jgi:hypothetical protein
LNEQLKGGLKKKIELNLMGHGLLLLLGLLMKDFTITLKQGWYQAHLLNYMGFGLGFTFA